MQGKIPSEHSADTKIYAGIDVCKAWLDVYLHPIGQAFRVANTPAGLKALKRRLAGMRIGRIVMEATGKFHRLAQRHLHAAGYPVAVVNPQWTHQFAKAIGQFAKTDRLDARVLALYGESIGPRALAPAPEALEALQELVNARMAAMAEQTALSNRQGTSQTAFLKAELAPASQKYRSPYRASRGRDRAACQSRPGAPTPGRPPAHHSWRRPGHRAGHGHRSARTRLLHRQGRKSAGRARSARRRQRQTNWRTLYPGRTRRRALRTLLRRPYRLAL